MPLNWRINPQQTQTASLNETLLELPGEIRLVHVLPNEYILVSLLLTLRPRLSVIPSKRIHNRMENMLVRNSLECQNAFHPEDRSVLRRQLMNELKPEIKFSLIDLAFLDNRERCDTGVMPRFAFGLVPVLVVMVRMVMAMVRMVMVMVMVMVTTMCTATRTNQPGARPPCRLRMEIMFLTSLKTWGLPACLGRSQGVWIFALRPQQRTKNQDH
eukprot:gnl/TRDRNA2_/TRDRNA2_172171_c1_seq1.p1 gnl/TRDRNA2_/TRDRNA2_172171_c1~~gnl/TRDRNA2_/TRDRNA2_172171_c1_seq1.p1  ORF type:complete len:214 (-),score=0.84 gnl/TRDRNA2_/TRDRNA2_172171_c1_seq1:203-844(-)